MEIAELTPTSTVLDKVELFASRVIANEMSEKVVFHDLRRTRQLVKGVKEIIAVEQVTEEERELLLVSAWMMNTGFKDVEKYQKEKADIPLLAYCMSCSVKLTERYLRSIEYPEYKMQKVLNTIKNAAPMTEPTNHLERILKDAFFVFFAKKGAKKEMKLMYEESLLTGATTVSKGTWFEIVLDYLEKHNYYTDYGRNHLEEHKVALIAKLRKEKKSLDKRQDLLLKKELDISDAELKKLKKDLKKQNARDDRGIQTMFRTSSKNHYTLNTMVDRKASIMISVNSIILSLILGSLVSGGGFLEKLDIIPTLLMTGTCFFSIFFAVMAIRPAQTHGQFTEEEVRNKKGNLLYFGNFHKMHPRDFEWGMLQMLNDKNYLYTTMIRDFYYLGQILNRKYKFIRKSLNIFVVGLATTAVVTILIKVIERLFI